MDYSLSLSAGAAQGQSIRRVLFAILGGGSAHTLLCWIALQLDFFRGGDSLFYSLFAVLWTGHALFIIYMLLGLNRRHAEPSMIFPLMLWSATGLIVTAVVVDQVRLSVMMMFFAIVQMGVLQASFRQFVWLAGYCVCGYAGVLVIVAVYWPEVVDLRGEWMQWGLFAVMVMAVTLLAAEISAIRRLLGKRNQQLADIVERIHDMAVKDDLTGFYCRRHAMELLGKACSQASRGAFPLAVAYLDLDHFKRINDRHGHGAGDQVLVRFAKVVQRCLGEQDFAARLGGEEFMLVMPARSCADAHRLLNTLLQGLRSEIFDSMPGLTVTASAGLAMFEADDSREDIVRRADNALYHAKQSGRDQVMMEPAG